MKYVVDRIIDNIAVIESIDDKSKMEVMLDKLPKNIAEGAVVVLENDGFMIDEETFLDRRKRIQEKFNKVLKEKDYE